MGFIKRLFGQSNENNGETPEFITYLNGCMEGLRLQTATHQKTWDFGQGQRWDFAMDKGELIFTFPDKIVYTSAQIIGTLDSQTSTWMWGWANSSIPEAIKKDSCQVREYGKQHQIGRLINSTWQAEEQDAWLMTALACRLCSSNGAYRGPAGTTSVFMTFGEVQIKKK